MSSFTPTALPLSLVALVAVMLYASAQGRVRVLGARPHRGLILGRILHKLHADLLWLYERWVTAVDHQLTALGQGIIFMAGMLVPLVVCVLIFSAIHGAAILPRP